MAEVAILVRHLHHGHLRYRRRRRQYAPATYTASHVDQEKKKRLGFIISMRVFRPFLQFLYIPRPFRAAKLHYEHWAMRLKGKDTSELCTKLDRFQKQLDSTLVVESIVLPYRTFMAGDTLRSTRFYTPIAVNIASNQQIGRPMWLSQIACEFYRRF